MAMWTHYYEMPDRFVEDERIWRDCMNGNQIMTDPQTGERTVEYDSKELRREGDFLISIKENRLHLCLSMDEVITVPDGVRSIATGAFSNTSTPNLRHLILPHSVDGIALEAIVCDGFEELTYYNDRIFVCDHAFEPRKIKRMHYPPEGKTWNLEEMWRKYEVAPSKSQRAIPMDPIDLTANLIDDLDLPF